jgi:hypothetical protein
MAFGVLWLFAACKPGTPSQYIQPGDMEDILVDYYMARAMAQQGLSSHAEREYNTALYTEAVFHKHGITKADFDSSLVYYYTRSDRFYPMFKRVTERLEEKALVLGASEGEIGKYAQYNATGDTANIWADRPVALLLPYPPYNHWDFQIEADSTYRRGDQLMLMFVSDFMYQTGDKQATAYLSADYGDTVVSRSQGFSSTGVNQLRFPEDTTRHIRTIKGFFYLGGANDATTTTRLLFLSNVQLIRFHTKDADYDSKASADSLSRDSTDRRLPPETVGGGDSLRSGDGVLSPDSGTAPHGVVIRRDSTPTR